MNKYSFTIFIVLALLTFSFSPAASSLNNKVQTFGCTIQSLPEETIRDIQNNYDNINSYSAVIENRLEGDRFDVDQEWQLSVQKPDKYRKTIIKINDQNLNPVVTTICNGNTYYTDETGTGRIVPEGEHVSCEALVAETFAVMEKLNLFDNTEMYESSAELDGDSVKVTIRYINNPPKSKTIIWANKNSYLIEKVEYKTQQLDDSVTTRTEFYKNVKLNENFELDEFIIPAV